MNIILAALRVNGVTSIEHATIEPEVIDFCKCFISMESCIEGIGKSRIVIHRKYRLHEFEHTVVGDRIEAGKNIAVTGLEYGTLDTFL